MDYISDKNTEIRLQHYMDAEGAEDFEPTKEQIAEYLFNRGYKCSFITIFYDRLQCFYRWYCDIKRIPHTTTIKK